MADEASGNPRIEAFFAYLEAKEALPAHVIEQARAFFRVPGDLRVGQVAILMGYLKPRDVIVVIAGQVDSDLRFGELAVQMGLLTTQQVDAALATQTERCLQVFEVIRLNFRVEEATAKELIAAFPAWAAANGRSVDEASDLPSRKVDGERVRARLRMITKVSTLPIVVQRVLSMLQDPNVNLEAIGRTLQGDPPIAAQVLRLANSAVFCTRVRASTVQRALVVLGMTNVQQVVLAATLMSQFSAGTKLEVREFWFQSILVGEWARSLAEGGSRRTSPEEAFIGGLMTNLGQMVIRQVFPKDHLAIQLRVLRGSDLLTAELECLGLSHPDIGAYLAHMWRFPTSLEEAILYHHARPSALRRLKLLPATYTINAATRLGELAPGAEVVQGVTILESDFLDAHDMGRLKPLEMAPHVFAAARELALALLGDT